MSSPQNICFVLYVPCECVLSVRACGGKTNYCEFALNKRKGSDYVSIVMEYLSNSDSRSFRTLVVFALS